MPIERSRIKPKVTNLMMHIRFWSNPTMKIHYRKTLTPQRCYISRKGDYNIFRLEKGMVIDNKLVITLDYSWKCCHFKRNYKNI
jgi:hypothetical protein